MRTFTRKTNRVNGVGGDKVRAADVNELQVAIEDLQDGTLTIDTALPSAGTTGQILAKASSADYDVEWMGLDGSGVLPAGSDGQQLRMVDGAAAFVRSKEAHLNDRADIDATGTDDMGETISTYLAEYKALGVMRVYCDGGSTYGLSTTITLPAEMALLGPYDFGTDAASAYNAIIRPLANDVTLVTMGGNGGRVEGMYFHLGNPTYTGTIGIQPAKMAQINENKFTSGASDSAAVQGFDLLYFYMRRNVLSVLNGRGVDLQHAPGSGGYYGMNVGAIEENFFDGKEGPLRLSGICTIARNDFEWAPTTKGTPSIEIGGDSQNSHMTIIENYFEMSNAGSGILFSSTPGTVAGFGAANVVRSNEMFTFPTGDAASYGIKFSSMSGGEIAGNTFARFGTGIHMTGDVIGTTESSIGIDSNQFLNCTTNHTGLFNGRWLSNNGTGVSRTTMLRHDNGRIVHSGALAGGVVQITGGTSIDLRYGNVFDLNYSSPTTPTVVNGARGQRITVHCMTGNTTLANSTWRLLSGADETPAAGTVKQFVVDSDNNLREIGQAKSTALTASDTGTVNSGDATTDDVIENLRTRLDELEDRLQARGMLA